MPFHGQSNRSSPDVVHADDCQVASMPSRALCRAHGCAGGKGVRAIRCPFPPYVCCTWFSHRYVRAWGRHVCRAHLARLAPMGPHSPAPPSPARVSPSSCLIASAATPAAAAAARTARGCAKPHECELPTGDASARLLGKTWYVGASIRERVVPSWGLLPPSCDTSFASSKPSERRSG